MTEFLLSIFLWIVGARVFEVLGFNEILATVCGYVLGKALHEVVKAIDERYN